MATQERSWIPYDQIVYSDEDPGHPYVECDAIWATGPDADGLIWVRIQAPNGLHGAVSVRADTICGRAFASVAVKPSPAPSPREDGPEGTP